MADEGEVNFSVCAVLPAAGSGSRMGLDAPKQFQEILGRPLISYTLDSFERVSWIQEIVVSVSENSLEEMKNILQTFNHSKVKLTLGGTTRHRSICNGIKELSDRPPNVVIIHDAVRPFVDESILRKVTFAAKAHGASGAVRPLVSTVIAINKEGFLDHSLERSKYCASEMPQAFRYDVISGAYDKCTEYDFEYGTECLHLAMTYSGVRAMLVHGPDSLWKVTHRKDLYAAEAILKESTKLKAVIISSRKSKLEQDLMLKMKNENIEVISLKAGEKKMDIGTLSVNVIVRVIRTDNSETTEREALMSSLDFSTEVLQCLNCSKHNRKAIVTVMLSSNQDSMADFKKSVEEQSKKVMPFGVQCFGITTDTSGHCDQDILPSKDCTKLISMITDVALHTSSSLSGQVFQYLW